MGLAMFCGVAVSAQASSLQITSSLSTSLGDTVSPPSGFANFGVLGANDGKTEIATFTFSLTQGNNFQYATAFYNAEGGSSSYIDTASLKYRGPNDSTWSSLWSASTSSGASDYVPQPIDQDGVVDGGFSGWNLYSIPVTQSGDYTFQLSVSNAGDGSKNDSLAFFAPVPEPSTFAAEAIVGILALAGCARKNRTTILKS